MLNKSNNLDFPGSTQILKFFGLLTALFLLAGSPKISAKSATSVDIPAFTADADTSKVYTVAEVMPEIEGGLAELYKKIKYPRRAVREGIEGRVFIQFIVDENGNATDPEILRDIGGGCGEAAIEAIRQVKFSPGRSEGQAVKVRFALPVTFKIQN